MPAMSPRLQTQQLICKKMILRLYFLDNHLSDGMGIDHIARIKKEHPSSYIIMITAHDTSTDREIAYKEGVDFFIGKPFTRDMILKAIEKIKFCLIFLIASQCVEYFLHNHFKTIINIKGYRKTRAHAHFAAHLDISFMI